ncbi:MAG: EamA/RhaT family transporter [Chitinophagia bacterium]|jgi:drug/metabolite transporter (DMT)-like permease
MTIIAFFWLFSSIILSSYLTLVFSYLGKTKADIFQVIVVNYFVCVITGSIANGSLPNPISVFTQPGGWGPIAMGIGFIAVFNLMAITTQRISVAVSAVANKLSFIIPVLLSVILFHESLHFIQWIGMVIALLAVAFTCFPSGNNLSIQSRFSFLFLPLLLFAGSGLLDTLMNYLQHQFIHEQNRHAYLISGFGFAGCIGICFAAMGYYSGSRKWNTINLLAGIALGIPNYFSIHCLVKFLSLAGNASSAGIAINNIGIVLLSALLAWVLFKQSLSKLNIIGILLAMIAIVMISIVGK